MSKQLRIWIFALLGTLLATSSLLAEGVITMTTTKAVGEKITLIIEANGNVTIEGVKEPSSKSKGSTTYILTSQTVIIRGDVKKLNVWNNQLTSLEASGCTALTELDCYKNPLTRINLSGCQSLENFWWNDGRLTSLDVSGCTALTMLDCYNNEIKGTEMTNLVNSLPDRQGAKEGAFHVFREVKHGDVDGNVCLAAHVAIAKAKNWRTLFYRDDESYDYAGLDKPTFVVTYSSSNGGSISITGADDLNAVTYGTELTIVATPADGYKLTALTANGTDILATKKVVIKGATEVKATFADNTGVETTVTQQMKLYPNPATDYVIVEGVAPVSEVTLHSMTGDRLYAGRADDRGTLQIDLTPYADGVYLVCVAGETYRVAVRH